MTIAEDLAITAEICGADFSDAAARVFVAELEGYEEAWVHTALERCRAELTGRLTLAAVISRLGDGRPGPEEAWALLPKDERASGVLSAEMAEAMSAALRLIAAGDQVAARMAFLESYKAAVSRARAEKRPVRWVPTLGWDQAGREDAITESSARNAQPLVPYTGHPELSAPTPAVLSQPPFRLPDLRSWPK